MYYPSIPTHEIIKLVEKTQPRMLCVSVDRKENISESKRLWNEIQPVIQKLPTKVLFGELVCRLDGGVLDSDLPWCKDTEELIAILRA